MIHEISDQNFFSKPLDFVEPIHFASWKCTSLSILSGLLLALSLQCQYLSILSWFAYVPFWLGMRGRKDKGVFGYGCLFGAVSSSSFLFFETSIGSILTLLASSAVFGVWAWFSRKMYFYLAFPKVNTTIADASRNQYILPLPKLILLGLASSFLWTFLEWSCSNSFQEFAILQIALSQAYTNSLAPIASFTGVAGISFLIILVGMSLALSLETKLIDRKSPIPWTLPVLAIIILSASIFLSDKYKISNETYNLISPAFIIDSIEARDAFGIIKVHQGLTLGVLINSQVLSSAEGRKLVRNGANILVCSSTERIQNAHRFAQCRALELGISYMLLLPTDRTPKDKNLIAIYPKFKPSFYYQHPYLFVVFVIVVTSIVLLVTGLHFYKRKAVLRGIINGK